MNTQGVIFSGNKPEKFQFYNISGVLGDDLYNVSKTFGENIRARPYQRQNIHHLEKQNILNIVTNISD